MKRFIIDCDSDAAPTRAAIEQALKGWFRSVSECSIAPSEFVEAARDIHGCDEIEIDEPANMSEGSDGVWIQAWVFVPGMGSEYVGDEEEEEQEP